MNHPPLTPTYILRGHASAIHSLHIFQQNLRLISADADGWIVVWDLVSKRPVTVWKGHEGAILQVRAVCSGWGEGVQVYSHGRDHKLRMWKIRPQDEAVLQKTLPVDVNPEDQARGGSQPWMVHSLPVNALNFCAFSILFVDGPVSSGDSSKEAPGTQTYSNEPTHSQLETSNRAEQTTRPSSEEGPPSTDKASNRLLAAPNALDSGAVDIFHLPLERRICTIPPPEGIKPGMVMAVELFLDSARGDVYLASGYEDGHVMVFRCHEILKDWKTVPGRGDRGQDQNQPWNRKWEWETLYVSRPHTQPVLSIDVSKTGGYVLSSGADAPLVKHPVPGWDVGVPVPGGGEPAGKPLKTVNTKHAGQQGLRIRDDGKIFATAGWDSRVRVYSCKTLKEVAVLKWHKEGCYAVAFAHIEAADNLHHAGKQTPESEAGIQSNDNAPGDQLIKRTEFSLAAVQQQRNQKVQNTHWLAAGSKDGKISLWDIY